MTEIGRFSTEPRNYDDSLILQNECSMCSLAKCSFSLSSGIMAERLDFFYCCIIPLILTLFSQGIVGFAIGLAAMVRCLVLIFSPIYTFLNLLLFC